MTLAIHKLSTYCRSPKGVEKAGALLDEVARGPLLSELAAQLGPSLDRLSAIVRMHTLRVELAIPARQLNASALADRWARAFTLALHKALAYPEHGGPAAVCRYQSYAEYTAALIQHLLTEGVAPTWRFPELREWYGRRLSEAALEFLLRQPAQMAEAIALISRANWLEPLLGVWDEIQLEKLAQAIARTEGAERGLDFASLVELGQAAAASGGLHLQWPMASRRQVVRLWARLAPRLQLRTIWHGMRLLVRLLEEPDWLVNARMLLSGPIPFPQWCERLVQELAALLLDAGQGRQRSAALPAHLTKLSQKRDDQANALRSVLTELRPLVPSAATPGQSGKWVESENCGILLLLSTVQRMGIFRLASTREFEPYGGQRALSFLLLALGMTLLGDWDWNSDRRIDPAVSLFAGAFAEIDRVGLMQFFDDSDVRAIADAAQGETWRDALQQLATSLARNFAQRIRGFRQASREAVVRQFVRIPGRVLVEDDRLLVVLSASPWAVALHISAMDDSLARVDWLRRKRVDFVLEGL